MIISHIKKSNGDKQSNEEHSRGVANLCKQFAAEFGMGEWGEVLGLLHDKGKEKKAFQQHIMKESGDDPNIKVEGDYSHAYVGALIAKEFYKPVLPLLAYPIMSHHAGLYDYPAYGRILEKPMPDNIERTAIGIKLDIPKLPSDTQSYDFNHIIRMLFSCLVDADYLDTEKFMNPSEASYRKGKKTLVELKPQLDNFLSNLKQNSNPSNLNTIREKIQDACSNTADDKSGFYSLTVPTGGGKTISSLVWAMNHAIKYNKKRIIIAIPYTSIIVQTAQVLRKIFGDENVLEHHSNISLDEVASGDSDLAEKMKLATENWDYPIIVTTNVQLFESMYSNRTSHCRKLHNLCNSVLILDEVQTLPTDFLQPILNALKAYQRQFGMSVLFTTASQPILGDYKSPNNPKIHLDGINDIKEIIPADYRLYDSLRRVDIHMEKGSTTVNEIAAELTKHSKALCIVNTRKVAQEIFSKLPEEGITIHLSRMMCPKHVGNEIKKVKDALQSDEYPIIRVVATQLIEAGVDIDFPVVYRQEAGLDSVLQAAGRCNREGKLDKASTFVFSLGKPLPKGFISQTNYARKNMLSRDFDWLSPEAMKEYFNQLYSRVETFDKADIKYYLGNPKEPMFATAADVFKLIDGAAKSVIVNWEDSMEWVEKLKKKGPIYSIMKKLSQYTVNIYDQDFKKLQQGGLIEEPIEGIYVITDNAQYDAKVGLEIGNHWLDEIMIK
ncbi:MAG: CRISPR-associated helicase Cas3' [Prevotella sp.]|nr:CRISPR-associated helicase Cas3' [Prevotella sp.]